VLNAQIAHELGEFRLSDVSRGIHDKIVRRHPHVFGNVAVDGIDSVLANWERLKAAERRHKRKADGLLDGVPLALPALARAHEYQARAARVGFDWPEILGILDKVMEEILELKSAPEGDGFASELGDLLFALVNLARWKGVDAEAALRNANRRFKSRFEHIERQAAERHVSLSDLSSEEMDALWREAKAREM